ncbi:MAG: hypothetical protein WB763_05825 [Terriglobia bacterium]|jgi:hypothetical protein
MNLLQNIWDWVQGQFVGWVPEDDALCEFDCRKPQCMESEWENCTRRLQRAAGELMPAKEPASEAVAESTPAKEPASATVAESTPANNVICHNSDRL